MRFLKKYRRIEKKIAAFIGYFEYVILRNKKIKILI